MAMLCGFLILSFYVVVAGWSFAYLWKMISGGLVGSSVDDMAAIFGANNSNPFSLGGKSLGQGGLARDSLDDLEGTIVSYAAAPGSVEVGPRAGLLGRSLDRKNRKK